MTFEGICSPPYHESEELSLRKIIFSNPNAAFYDTTNGISFKESVRDECVPESDPRRQKTGSVLSYRLLLGRPLRDPAVQTPPDAVHPCVFCSLLIHRMVVTDEDTLPGLRPCLCRAEREECRVRLLQTGLLAHHDKIKRSGDSKDSVRQKAPEHPDPDPYFQEMYSSRRTPYEARAARQGTRAVHRRPDI